MVKAGWAIRIFDVRVDEDEEDGTISTVGNFSNYGNRQLDEIVTFNAMYGLDDYMVWEIHKNIGDYDFSTVGLNLKIFYDMTKALLVYEGNYRPLEVKYDSRKGKYYLYAIAETSMVLRTPLVGYGIESLSYKENRSAEDVLRDVLEGKKIFKLVFYDSNNEYDYEYRSMTFDPDDEVYDFINKICTENLYEWYVEDNICYVGKELPAYKENNSSLKDTDGSENEAETASFYKVAGSTRTMSIMSHIGEKRRCVWFKHSVGKSGGLSKGCFVNIGFGTLDRELYFSSLENIREINSARRLTKRKKENYTRIGNIVKDEGAEFIDEVSVQRNFKLSKTRTPRDVLIDRNEESSSETQVKQLKEKIGRTTPYLDHNAGIMFPVPTMENTPPNVLIHNIDGGEEGSVVGGFIFGNGKNDFAIPVKNKGDFRFKLPGENGGNIFWDSTKKHWVVDGERIMFKNMPTKAEDEVDSTYSDEGAHITLFKDDSIVLENEVTKITLFEAGCWWFISNKYKVQFDGTDGTISIFGDGPIEIDGLTLKLQGGGNKLSHADHKHGYDHIHTTGNLGMPVPGFPTATHIGGILIRTDAHLSVEGTQTTEAD